MFKPSTVKKTLPQGGNSKIAPEQDEHFIPHRLDKALNNLQSSVEIDSVDKS